MRRPQRVPMRTTEQAGPRHPALLHGAWFSTAPEHHLLPLFIYCFKYPLRQGEAAVLTPGPLAPPLFWGDPDSAASQRLLLQCLALPFCRIHTRIFFQCLKRVLDNIDACARVRPPIPLFITRKYGTGQ